MIDASKCERCSDDGENREDGRDTGDGGTVVIAEQRDGYATGKRHLCCGSNERENCSGSGGGKHRPKSRCPASINAALVGNNRIANATETWLSQAG